MPQEPVEPAPPEPLAPEPAPAATPARAPAKAAEPEAHWRFAIEPYVWVPGVTGQAQTDDTPPLDIDLVGQLSAAFLLGLRARSPGGRFSVLSDGFYVQLKDEEGALKTSTEAAMVELGVGWALDRRKVWNAIAGARYVDVRYDASTGMQEGKLDTDWVDPWVGVHGMVPLGGRWSTILRGDVGGFGVGSEFSWQAMALLRAHLGGSASLDLGYRAISFDFKDTGTSYDVIFHGPLVGLSFSF